MRARLAVLGPVVLTTPTGADFVVQGQVAVVPQPRRQERVEIQWIVKTAAGDERGRVVQLNEIPAGTLDHYWGDVAVVVAAEASSGVNDIIQRQSGHDPPATIPALRASPPRKPLIKIPTGALGGPSDRKGRSLGQRPRTPLSRWLRRQRPTCRPQACRAPSLSPDKAHAASTVQAIALESEMAAKIRASIQA